MLLQQLKSFSNASAVIHVDWDPLKYEKLNMPYML